MPFFIPVFRDVSGGGCQNPYLFGKNFNLLGFFEKKIPNPPTPQNFSFIQENLNPLLKKFLDTPLPVSSSTALEKDNNI